MSNIKKRDIFKPEIVYTTDRHVYCDGDGGALGHPRTYYVIGDTGFVECLYCDRRFVLEKADIETH